MLPNMDPTTTSWIAGFCGSYRLVDQAVIDQSIHRASSNNSV